VQRHSAFDAAHVAAGPPRATTTVSPVSGVVYAGDHPTVRIIGRVDRAVTSQVRGWIRGLLAAGAQHLVVDVSEAVDCDVRLLTVLADANARLAADGDSFAVVGLQLPEFIDALPRASLDELFVVYDVVRREAGRTRAPTPRSGRHRRGTA
jgi:anti-anti-sigma regulatory factor